MGVDFLVGVLVGLGSVLDLDAAVFFLSFESFLESFFLSLSSFEEDFPRTAARKDEKMPFFGVPPFSPSFDFVFLSPLSFFPLLIFPSVLDFFSDALSVEGFLEATFAGEAFLGSILGADLALTSFVSTLAFTLPSLGFDDFFDVLLFFGFSGIGAGREGRSGR